MLHLQFDQKRQINQIIKTATNRSRKILKNAFKRAREGLHTNTTNFFIGKF